MCTFKLSLQQVSNCGRLSPFSQPSYKVCSIRISRRSKQGLEAARSSVYPLQTLTGPAEMSFYHVYRSRIEPQLLQSIQGGERCEKERGGIFIISSSLRRFQASLSCLAKVYAC